MTQPNSSNRLLHIFLAAMVRAELGQLLRASNIRICTKFCVSEPTVLLTTTQIGYIGRRNGLLATGKWLVLRSTHSLKINQGVYGNTNSGITLSMMLKISL
jgi:hypothetical protein